MAQFLANIDRNDPGGPVGSSTSTQPWDYSTDTLSAHGSQTVTTSYSSDGQNWSYSITADLTATTIQYGPDGSITTTTTVNHDEITTSNNSYSVHAHHQSIVDITQTFVGDDTGISAYVHYSYDSTLVASGDDTSSTYTLDTNLSYTAAVSGSINGASAPGPALFSLTMHATGDNPWNPPSSADLTESVSDDVSAAMQEENQADAYLTEAAQFTSWTREDIAAALNAIDDLESEAIGMSRLLNKIINLVADKRNGTPEGPVKEAYGQLLDHLISVSDGLTTKMQQLQYLRDYINSITPGPGDERNRV